MNVMKSRFLHFVAVLLLSSLNLQAGIKSAVTGADIIRTTYFADGTLPLYIGNGRFGGCFDQSGLQYHPSVQEKMTKQHGATTLMHISNYERGKFDMDYLLPVARLYWDTPLENVRQYSQRQSMYDGTIETSYISSSGKMKVKVWFDAVDRNMMCVKTEASGSYRLVIDFPDHIKTHYGNRFSPKVDINETASGWLIEVKNAELVHQYWVLTDANVEIADGNMLLDMSGRKSLRISYSERPTSSPESSLARTVKWWHSKWETTALVLIPDPDVMNFYVRQMAQLYYTCNDDGKGLMPPCGLSGNQWPFAFPHDLAFILPSLLSNGDVDIAKAWVEYIARDISELRNYTLRVFGVEGICPPWCFSYAGMKGLNEIGVPNRAFYEIHNAGHLCRMAYETSLFVNDKTWTERYAQPLIDGCAEFYRNMLVKEYDGRWHIFNIPSFGQDENGGSNQKDYLCALYSAKYSFEIAVECGRDYDGFYKKVLKEGLAFSSLKSNNGYLFSCAGRGEKDFGNQKHPPQLNEIAMLPMSDPISPESIAAYNDRYEIVERASEPFFRGWTEGSFILSSARLGNEEGWKKDWNSCLEADVIDKELIQFYESSRLFSRAYFTTNSGMFVGSIQNCAVCDWDGTIRVGNCIPWQGTVSFQNIRSKLGVTVSGRIDENKREVMISAWKDCSVVVDGHRLSLAQGETVQLDYNVNDVRPVEVNPEFKGKLVDLGLSVSWADCNLGASLSTESGVYCCWGEWKSMIPVGMRVPTENEWSELLNTKNCKWQFVVKDGVKGYLVTSKKTGYEDKSIFLPSAGCFVGTKASSIGRDGFYWSSTGLETNTDYAWSIYAVPSHVYKLDALRFLRQSVRLVAE